MTASASGNAATQLPLGDLVLDPSMQCRMEVVASVVADYAEALDGGAVFPPIRVMRVPEDVAADPAQAGRVRLLVVDGWHRVEAHRKAGKETVAAIVVDGTMRQARHAAAGANTDHGLQRTTADKRRAVKLLLMDAEDAALSSRELAKLAGVSHTYVDQERKRYGVKKGELLDEARAAHVDGELVGEWKELARDLTDYQKVEFEAIRTAADPLALTKATQHTYLEKMRKARDLRRREFATEPWPWDEDTGPMFEERATERLATVDTVEDIERMVRSKHCTGAALDAAYQLLAKASRIPTYIHDLEYLVKEWARRPRLLAEVEKRLEEARAREAAKPKDQWDLAREIRALKEAPDAQAEALLAVPEAMRKDLLSVLSVGSLHPEVRDGAYRDLVDPNRKGADCPDPNCKGWVPLGQYSACVVCRQRPEWWTDTATKSLTLTSRLLWHPGYGFRVGDAYTGVVVDEAGVELLAELDRLVRGDEAPALHKALKKYSTLAGLVTRFASRGVPEVLFVDPTAKPAEPTGGDQDEGDDEQHEAAIELGVRSFHDGRTRLSVQAWLPEPLHDAWREGFDGASPGGEGWEPREDWDEDLEDQVQFWKDAASLEQLSTVDADERCARGVHFPGEDKACLNCHEPADA